jgi:hypothetical protein
MPHPVAASRTTSAGPTMGPSRRGSAPRLVGRPARGAPAIHHGPTRRSTPPRGRRTHGPNRASSSSPRTGGTSSDRPTTAAIHARRGGKQFRGMRGRRPATNHRRPHTRATAVQGCNQWGVRTRRIVTLVATLYVGCPLPPQPSHEVTEPAHGQRHRLHRRGRSSAATPTSRGAPIRHTHLPTRRPPTAPPPRHAELPRHPVRHTRFPRQPSPIPRPPSPIPPRAQIYGTRQRNEP